MVNKHWQKCCALLAAGTASLLLTPFTSLGTVTGPYSPDANTVHLWHFNDEAGLVATNAVAGGPSLLAVNGASVVNPLPSTALVLVGDAGASGGFGSAATYTNSNRSFGLAMDASKDGSLQPDALSTTDKVAISSMVGADGAFTFEAIIKLSQADLDTLAASGNKEIICMDSSSNPRGFQFRLNGKILEFNPIAVSGGLLSFDLAGLPAEHAYAPNTWFHVAVTYNGAPSAPDNLKLYWTRLDATFSEANLVATTTLSSDMTGSATAVLIVGNENRAAFGESFGGSTGTTTNYIDEVRISRVAREADEMLFAGEILTFSVNPSNTVAAVGQPVTLSARAQGIPPITYQWRHYGTNLPGATNTTYSIAAATADDGGTYDVVASNPVSTPATSQPATVTIRTVVDSLVWNNYSTYDYQWDFTSLNWSNATSHAFPVAFQQGDVVRLDDSGMAGPLTVSSTIMPGALVVDSAAEYTFTGSGKLSGPMSLTKTGTGGLTVETDNDYTGTTTVSAGVLRVGNGGNTGSLGTGDLINNGQISFNRLNAVSVRGNISGAGFISQDNSGTTILLGANNTWTSGPLINFGTLQIGDGGEQASLGSGTITNNGTLRLNTSRSGTIAPDIEGTGIVHLLGSGTQTLSGSNSWTGSLLVSGDTHVRFSRPEAFGAQINRIGEVNQNTSRIELTGGQTLTNAIQIIPRAYRPTDATIPNSAPHFLNVSGDNVLNPPSSIAIPGGGNLLSLQSDSGSLLVTAGVELTVGGTPRYVLLQGEGNGEIQGVLAETPANATLSLYKLGTGTWTLSGSSPLRGPTVVSNGTLVISGSLTEVTNQVNVYSGALAGSGTVAGPVLVAPGATLAPGAGLGTLTINNSLALQAGSTTAVEINKSTGSSDKVAGLSSVSYAGTLVVTNIDGTLALGDSFQIFTATSASGNFDTITPAPGAGQAWSFDPATGVLSVVAGQPANPTSITFSMSASGLSLSWPNSHLGWQVQSNSTSLSDPGAWHDVPGSQSATSYTVTPNSSGNVFYRLHKP
jgi:autotransporter-associated beta strand protein